MSVVIVGTLDTKAEEIGFAREVIEDRGLPVHVIDTGVLGEPGFEPDTSSDAVARLAGTSLEALREAGDRGEAVDAMGRGAAARVRELHEAGELDAVLGLGGSGNTSIATAAMRALPYGVPKVMVSTMAAGDVEAYVGARDIAMVNAVADIEGLNRLTRRIISNAALAVVGMVENEPPEEPADRPTVGVTMFGVTTPCVKRAREYLEERGYEVIVFHATGTGGRAMEDLVRQGTLDAVLDVTTTEWADELVGGVLAGGEDRLEAPGEAGIPHVVAPGALDMVNFGPRGSVPAEFEGRRFHRHNPQVTLMRTTPEENADLGRILAEKLAGGAGPRAVFLPLRGVSMLDVEGEDFHDPEADAALFDAIREHLPDDVALVEMETDVNDESFALAMARKLDEFVTEATDREDA